MGLLSDAQSGLAALIEEVQDLLSGRPAEKVSREEISRRREAYLSRVEEFASDMTPIVLNNASFGWIKAGQKLSGGKYFSVDFSRTNHAKVAEAYGMHGLNVESPGELREALRQGLTAQGPALVDILVQPLEEARAPVSQWIA